MNIIFWAISWLFSMILFVLILQYSNLQNASPVEIGSIAVVLIFGIVSYSKFILKIEKAIKIKYPRIIGAFFTILAFIFSLGIGIGILVLLFNVLPKPQNTNVQAEKSKYTLLQSPLKIGSSGEDVKVLQAVLKQNKNIYPSGNVSGYYGQLTKEAVIDFQKNNGLPQTGEMDETTISKFNEVYGSQSREQYLNTAPTSSPNTVNPQAQTIIQTNVDSDPIVNCLIHEKCGGGSMKIKKSLCDNSICCFYPDKNVFYLDKSQCKSSSNTTNSNYVYPTTSVYTYPTVTPQNNAIQNNIPQPTIDNTGARARCIGDVNIGLESAIVSLRNYVRANNLGEGSYYYGEKASLENAAASKRYQCELTYL